MRSEGEELGEELCELLVEEIDRELDQELCSPRALDLGKRLGAW